MQFTAASLNTGFFAMAEKLDLCDIENVATKMGVRQGNGDEVDDGHPLLGHRLERRLAARHGRGVRDGREQRNLLPAQGDRPRHRRRRQRDHAAPDDLHAGARPQDRGHRGVRAAGRHAAAAEQVPDRTRTTARRCIGKTGTHEDEQTWIVESSTKVATAVWVGNSQGVASLSKQCANGFQLNNMRYRIDRRCSVPPNAAYGGDAFPQPDRDLHASGADRPAQRRGPDGRRGDEHARGRRIRRRRGRPGRLLRGRRASSPRRTPARARSRAERP